MYLARGGHPCGSSQWSDSTAGGFVPLPKVLETPKGTDPVSKREWDAVNLERLRRLGMR